MSAPMCWEACSLEFPPEKYQNNNCMYTYIVYIYTYKLESRGKHSQQAH